MSSRAAAIPGCVVCVVGSTRTPDGTRVPRMRSEAELAVLGAGLRSGATTTAAFVFTYGIAAVRAALCPDHARAIERIEQEWLGKLS